MATESPARVITCAKCGQRMRVAQNATARAFKCVKCGAIVENTFLSEPEAAPLTGAEFYDPVSSLLLEAKQVTQDQVDEALELHKQRGGKIFDILVQLGHLKKEAFQGFQSRQSGIAGISLAHFTLDREMTIVLPREMVMKHLAIPIDRLGRLLTVAMICPLDMEAIADIQRVTGLRVKPMLCSYDDFHAVVQKYFRLPDASPGIETNTIETLTSGRSEAPSVEVDIPEKADSPEKKTVSTEDSTTISLDLALRDQITERIEKLERFEVCSRHVTQIATLIGTGRDSVRQIIAVLSNAPTLAATVLAATNTAAYGLAEGVDNLPMGVVLLGENGVNLLAANARQMNPVMEKHLSLLNRQARQAGDIAALLASSCGRAIPNIAQAAGLLHTVGSFALAVLEPEEYRKIDRRLWGASRVQAERQVFGIGHAEAGGRLLERWHFPVTLFEVVKNYLTPEDAGDYRDLACLVHLGVISISPEGELQDEAIKNAKAIADYLGLTPDEVRKAAVQATAT